MLTFFINFAAVCGRTIYTINKQFIIQINDMKKTALLSLAFAAFAGISAGAQEAQEVTYTQDEAQGLLINRFRDNWFITAEGGANILFTPNDSRRDLTDRFAPQAGLYVGKWFTPIFGGRVGAVWMANKSVTDRQDYFGYLPDEPTIDGKYYKCRENFVGPVFDVMINLTNWWCGYSPTRVYDLIAYAGAGGYFVFNKEYNKQGESLGYKDNHDRTITIRAGLINNFNLSKHVSLALDIRYVGYDNHTEYWGRTAHDLQANLALTYKFNKTGWTAPVVPVVAPAENCDAYRARLQAADARIADLEAQLRDCLNRPVKKEIVKEAAGPLATIYFPINVSSLTSTDRNVLKAVAGVMTSHPDKVYSVTGWADNYTGNNTINTRLRKARAASVEAQLKKTACPHHSSRLASTTATSAISARSMSLLTALSPSQRSN